MVKEFKDVKEIPQELKEIRKEIKRTEVKE
jgi:hypothetical protein